MVATRNRSKAEIVRTFLSLGGVETHHGQAGFLEYAANFRGRPAIGLMAFDRGEPYRVIAPLELLATVVSLILLSPESSPGVKTERLVMVAGMTDSMVSSLAVGRGLSSSFPLSLLPVHGGCGPDGV